MSLFWAFSTLLVVGLTISFDRVDFPNIIDALQLQDGHQSQLRQLETLINKAIHHKSDPGSVGADVCNTFSDSNKYLLSKHYIPDPLDDIYVRFHYFTYESTYDDFFGEWVNTTTFGRLWYWYTSDAHKFRINGVQYDESSGDKTMFDSVADITNEEVSIFYQVGDDDDVACYSYDSDFELDNRTYADSGQVYLAMDDSEYNWILWGSVLTELCYAYEDFNDMFYLDGYDIFDDNEYRYSAELNDTYSSIDIYGEWLYEPFSVSEVSIPDSVAALCTSADEIENGNVGAVKLEQTETKKDTNDNSHNVEDTFEELTKQYKLDRIVEHVLKFRF